MKQVDFLASERHFLDHLAPTWHALPEDARGVFYVPDSLLRYAIDRKAVDAEAYGPSLAHAPSAMRKRSGLVVSAASGNQSRIEEAGRPSIFSEHGAGQTYRRYHSSYAGWRWRKGVRLFLCPGPHPTRLNRHAYPATPVEDIGVPKLDAWHRGDIARPANARPIVAISFHWDCKVVPETRSAFNHYREALKTIAGQDDFQVIGHGHPRIIRDLAPAYEKAGIEVVRDFDEVMARADVYAVDNSSTLFEFASTDRPVIVLNAPWYRRDIRHGLRFWEAAPVGVQVERPDDLFQAIRTAIADADDLKRAREEALRLVYTYRDGNAAKRAADAIVKAIFSLPAKVRRPIVRSVTVSRNGTFTTRGSETMATDQIEMIARTTFRSPGRIINQTNSAAGPRVNRGDRFLAIGRKFAEGLNAKKLATYANADEAAPATAKPGAPATRKPNAPSTPKTDGEPNTEKANEPPTRKELYDRAKELDIPGRSGMNADELAAAIRKHEGTK